MNLDERKVNPMNEMTHIAVDFLNLPSRGFQVSYRNENSRKLIYDSECCRISLIWEGWDQGTGNTIELLYGRLHAPNEKETMEWNGEECRSWHRVEYALHFLDQRTPAETAKLRYSHPLTDHFYEAEITQKYHRRQPEWLAEIHVSIWQHYGKRLFDLFDLRQPELWRQYQQFLKEVYDIAGRKPRPGPPMDKVC